jgi:guanosine-3',5'-bis(diphosphate) 3'-pyrophosphohydrolase
VTVKISFKKGVLLSKMLVLATNSHAGQFDKGDNPYILHPLAVMNILRSDDEELNCIALGHDIVEDCKVSYSQLKELGFTDRIINGIKCMTKVPGETYEEYKAKVKSNPDSIRVKIADLTHNTDIKRLKGVEPKDIARMEKYFKFYIELTNLLAEK